MNVTNLLGLFLVTETLQLILLYFFNCQFSYQFPRDNLLSSTRLRIHAFWSKKNTKDTHSLTYLLHFSYLSTLCFRIISSCNHFTYHVILVRCHQIEWTRRDVTWLERNSAALRNTLSSYSLYKLASQKGRPL
jgi:hypothetical protein